MRGVQFQYGSPSPGLASRGFQWKRTRTTRSFPSSRPTRDFGALIARKGLGSAEAVQGCHMSVGNRTLFSAAGSRLRKPICSASRDSGVDSSEILAVEERPSINGQEEDVFELTGKSTTQSPPPDVKRELVLLSVPAFVGQAIDPLAQLLETAYIGRLGPVELGSAGVSVSIFNIISKLFNIPLLSVATSFVAEDISMNAIKDNASGDEEEHRLKDSTNGKPFDEVIERKQLSSVSTALLLAVGIGLFEAVALFFGSGVFLDLMGISSASPMRIPAEKFLSLRAIGAPAVVLSLTLQGIFRGFKDTKTPVLCLGIGNVAAIFMIPILMYHFRLGVIGAAISTVVSQYIVTFLMMWHLNKRVVLLAPKMKPLQFGGYIKSGGFVVGRTIAVLVTMTVGTSMAARQGPVFMAAHQICMQIWLAVSLLTDALATSAQAMIASYVSKGEYKTVKKITNFVLKIGLLTGVALAVILGLTFGSLAPMFTKDTEVLRIIKTGILFVSASQPINALAFIYDGLHFGASDFPYAACSMMLVGAISTVFLLYAPGVFGLPGVWMGLTLFMGLRMTAGHLRLQSKTGPWWFLHTDKQKTEIVG